MKFLAVVAEEILIRKYLNKIWQLIKYSLLVVMQRWHHNVSQVQTC